MESMIMIVALMAVMYFFMIRPENKRKKQAQNMRDSLKKGDMITTIGGIVGKIVMVNPNTIVIETSDDRVRMELTKWAVSQVGVQTGEQPEAEFNLSSQKSLLSAYRRWQALFLMYSAKAELQIRRSFAVRSRKRGVFARMQLPGPIRLVI